MSRYLILLIVNTPFIIGGLLSALVTFKLRRISKQRFAFQITLWLTMFLGLALAHPIYNFLFSNKLTQTEPLSLFDVIQITGIITLLFVVARLRSKMETVERRLQDLHQELSIKLSQDQ